jgi:AmmeMemoRadiSam system protein A
MADKKPEPIVDPELPNLSEDNRRFLKTIARESIESYVLGRQPKRNIVDDPALKAQLGAFVTLKSHGDLRGCIGAIFADKPLVDTIAELAIKSAAYDPRFAPVGPAELDDLDLEISILGHVKQVHDINEIKIGRDGLIIEQGHHRGLLLPQVATEHHLDLYNFLAQTCLKAGLPMDSWQHGAKIFRFSAEVF